MASSPASKATRLGLLIGVAVLLWPGPCLAQARPEAGPFARGAVGVELGAAVLPEAWNLNDSREWVAGGSFSTWWAFADGRVLVVEFQAVAITQAEPRTAFVNGITPTIRCRLLERGPATVFVEFGAGVSWSDARVPPRGTRFNYLALASLGVTRRLTAQTSLVASVRWLHLSNASMEGRHHNPDIEAVGGFIGLNLRL